MSDLVNAICECHQWSESNFVVAKKKSFFDTTSSWGFTEWSGALLFIVVTSGFGALVLYAYRFAKYRKGPHYQCMTCGADVHDENVRI